MQLSLKAFSLLSQMFECDENWHKAMLLVETSKAPHQSRSVVSACRRRIIPGPAALHDWPVTTDQQRSSSFFVTLDNEIARACCHTSFLSEGKRFPSKLFCFPRAFRIRDPLDRYTKLLNLPKLFPSSLPSFFILLQHPHHHTESLTSSYPVIP